MHRRLNQLLRTGELGPVAQALDHQIIERHVVRNQRDDALGRLDRRDHRLGVEHQELHQVGRGDQQLAGVQLHVLAPMVELGERSPVVGFETLPRAGVRARHIGELLGVGDGFPVDRQQTAGLLKIEIGLGHCQHRVVICGVHPGLVGVHYPLRRDRHVDGVRESKNCARSVERCVTRSR